MLVYNKKSDEENPSSLLSMRLIPLYEKGRTSPYSLFYAVLFLLYIKVYKNGYWKRFH